MPDDMSHTIFPLVIILFVIWLLYRINNRIANNVMGNRMSKDFPFLKASAENFQRKIDYLNSQIEVLGQRINHLESEIKAMQK